MTTRWGGFLERIDQFDSHFFGISPREAARMDPQQRLLLEVSWEALEDAGQAVESLSVARVGVFLGISSNDYSRIRGSDPALIDAYAGTGNALSIAANRISYIFDFKGPSIAIDTACSSSLVAVRLACVSLLSGECTHALAGGVNLMLSPEITIIFSKAGVMAPDGRCKVFDARADGYVRGEGAGMVVLKRLSSAQIDGDPIYAVILGSAVNQDGRTNGLMAPGRQAQEEVLREAYKSSRVSPAEIQYVELHGTGTLLGDSIEAKALGKVLTLDRASDCPCAVGSVKTNIGHLEAAAGIAGLIKVALSLHHQMIPSSLHFEKPNPHIPFDELPLRIQQKLSPWPKESGVAIAGVSSFGFGGTNAHMVLREAPRVSQERKNKSENEDEGKLNYKWAQLLPLSAHSPEALQALARLYRNFFQANQFFEGGLSLRDICYTASMRRSHHDHRLSLAGFCGEELVEQLEAFIQGESRPNMFSTCKLSGGRRKVVFVFSARGSQWPGMGRELLEHEVVFRSTLQQCDQEIRRHLDWSLLEELASDEAQWRLEEEDVLQPLLFSIQVALAALWRSWGIEPDAVVGYSLGEVAAAYVSGALSLEDAVLVICNRSRVLKQVSGKGSMAVIELSLEKTQQELRGYKDHVSIAASSSSTITVLSGEPTVLGEVLEKLEQQGIFCLSRKENVAGHSSQLDPLCDDLLHALEGLKCKPPSLPIYSTVTGRLGEDLAFDANYWVRNLREPVHFSSTVKELVLDGYEIFLEISPHPNHLSSIREEIHLLRKKGTVLPSLRKKKWERVTMLSSLGILYTLGYPLDWSKLYPSGGRWVRLPSYPWQRERHWLEQHHVQRNENIHPILGHHLNYVDNKGMYSWEMKLSPDLFPYIDDHRVKGEAVLPGAAYVEIALAAYEEAFGSGLHVLEKVVFKKALFLSKEDTQTVRLIIYPEMPGTSSFQFFSLQAGVDTEQQPFWELHAVGTIYLGDTNMEKPSGDYILPAKVQSRCSEVISKMEYYKDMDDRGIYYGPSFQGVEQIRRKDGEAIGRIQLPELATLKANGYKIHPALLDAIFQVLGAAASTKNANIAKKELFLPASLDSFRVYNSPRSDIPLWSYALLHPEYIESGAEVDSLKGDVFLLDDNGEVILEARGLNLKRQAHKRKDKWEKDLDDRLYEIQWEPRSHPHVGHKLRLFLEEQGETCVMVFPGKTSKIAETGDQYLNPAEAAGYHQLLNTAFGSRQPPCRGVVHLWSLETGHPVETTLSSIEAAQELGSFSVLHLVQALARVGWRNAPRLWSVTRGTQLVGTESEEISISQCPLWGLRNTLFYEHSELRNVIVDLDTSGGPEEIQMLFQELWRYGDGPNEDRIALRGGMRYVARLVRYPLERLGMGQQKSPQEINKSISSEDQPFRLEITTPGNLDSLTLRETPRRQPGPGEVELQVYATGLNFLDILSAMGVWSDTPDGIVPLGLECSGKVTALGEGVENFHVGDEVITIAHSSIGTFVTTTASMVAPKPTRLSFEEAATIPVAFFTAYYALNYLARLGNGERVLIHAATGGVGLAAVQIAQKGGAEIFATAGSPEKRDFLRSQGIEHVMDSRALTFADEVMAFTEGEGVDVVLNSLPGEAIPRGLSTLKANGRFIEIGKIDIYQNRPLHLGYFQKNVSFFTIDLLSMVKERPEFCGVILRELVQYFENETFKISRFQLFPISEYEKAFRFMSEARHIGKIILSLQEQEVLVTPSIGASVNFRSDGAYLITGGLGGLGLEVSRWMVEHGARHLVLMGRREPSDVALKLIQEMKEAGAHVVVERADVTQEEQVSSTLAGIRQSGLPLRGIIHAAGLLDDGVLLQLDRERFRSVMAPKINGAWNLHSLTLDEPLDFFVLFSSAASVLGSPGQGNYSAANAFLDTLAHYRKTLGKPALSINWGPWAKVGMAVQPGRGGRLAIKGLESIKPQQGIELLGRLLHQEAAQVVAMAINWEQFRYLYSTGNEFPLLSHLIYRKIDMPLKAGTSKGKGNLTRKILNAAEPGERQQLLDGVTSI
jgi:acyl transferase domain-containing protein/NADPH:quinone reductase-like Zn-dependent oxidoreductase